MRIVLLFALLLFPSFAAKLLAVVRLPPIISDNMVLQQNAQVTLWGWAGASERFVIISSWKSDVDSVTAFNSGKWKAKIKTPSAGGPYTITIKGRWNTIELTNILIGRSTRSGVCRCYRILTLQPLNVSIFRTFVIS